QPMAIQPSGPMPFLGAGAPGGGGGEATVMLGLLFARLAKSRSVRATIADPASPSGGGGRGGVTADRCGEVGLLFRLAQVIDDLNSDPLHRSASSAADLDQNVLARGQRLGGG